MVLLPSFAISINRYTKPLTQPLFVNRSAQKAIQAVSIASTAEVVSKSLKADLINWPEGLKPKKGKISKSSLLKLKVANLKDELSRRSLKAEGNKEALVEALFAAISTESLNTVPFNLTYQDRPPAEIRVSEIKPSSSKHKKDVKSSDSKIELHMKNLIKIEDINHDIYKADIYIDGELPEELSECGRHDLIDALHVNKTRMQFIFLGTAMGSPTKDRCSGCLAFRTQSDTWLFDIGEDAQRQTIKHPALRPGKIARLFVTTLTNDLITGIPGILCTIAASKERGHSLSDIPLHVYGPPGLSSYIKSIMELSQTYLEMPVIIHEFVKKPKDTEVVQMTARARLWRVYVPPDVYNPDGYYDAHLNSIKPLQRTYTMKTGRRSSQLNTTDGRACYRKIDLPSPGDPSRYPERNSEICWTLYMNDAYKVMALPLNNEIPSIAYVVQEAGRAGHLDPKKAEELGVKPGKNFMLLKNGESVQNSKGEVVTPAMVVSGDDPGRTIVIMGETDNIDTIKESLGDVDILISPLCRSNIDDGEYDFSKELKKSLKMFKEVGAKKTIISRIPKK